MRIGIDATPIPLRPGGAGNYIIQLIRHLAELESFQSGRDSLVIISQSHGQALIQDRCEVLSRQAKTTGVEWVIVPGLAQSSKMLSSTRPLMPPPVRLAWEQLALPYLVRSLRLDLLHSTHYTRPLFLPCRSVVTFHDMTFFLFPELHTRAKRLFFPIMMRLSALRADALIASSENTRQDAIRLLKISPGCIQTIHLGVDNQFHQVHDPYLLNTIRGKYHLPGRFILYVGTVEPRKNLPLLIESYSLLKTSQRIPLVIVGQMGWNYQEIFNQIERLGLKNRVQFTGYIPQADLPIVYNLAELFVYPSLYEGFGLPPLEAMACGTPVITSAVSSMPEHVGECGVLVPPNDPQSLSSAIHELILDEERRLLLSSRGLQKAAKFSWRQTAQQTFLLYHKILKPA